MIDRVTKLRWRRRLRKSRRQVEDISLIAEDLTQKHFIRRLSRLWEVRRFVGTWIVLMVLLIVGVSGQIKGLDNHYKKITPVTGGTFSEGILGTFTTANPLYASNPVDSAASHLIFSGLLKYDSSNKLVGDLAQSWSVDPSEKIYRITLRPNLKWHDDSPLTAQDVIFTYKTIQNPDAKSPLNPSWSGIKVTAVNALTVTFELPSTLSAFPHSLTNGIVPQHVLEGIPVNQLRSISFNTSNPIGSGPFRWETLETVNIEDANAREEHVGLLPYDNYHFGKPKLSRFVLRSFRDEKRMTDSFNNQEIQAMAGLHSVPNDFKNNSEVDPYSIPLTSEVLTFFKVDQDVLRISAVRKALILSVSPGQILKSLDQPVSSVRSPILPGQIGYNKSLVQRTDINLANGLLDQAGFIKDPTTGIRSQGKLKLTFKLTTQNTDEYQKVANSLKEQWRQIGADVEIVAQPEQDIQTTLANHNYDALLYGISIGPDPDVFAYWHSSQFDLRSPTRLNFSEYRSKKADDALEAGRTRSDALIRTVKYKPFLESWLEDAPALSLYQPNFVYIAHKPFYGKMPTSINNGVGRYADVQDWMIREEKLAK